MSGYERVKLGILGFIAIILFAWSVVGISSIIRFNDMQDIASVSASYTADIENVVVDMLVDIVERLERLENH